MIEGSPRRAPIKPAEFVIIRIGQWPVVIVSGPVRVVEVLAALSLTTDLASGLPFEKGCGRARWPTPLLGL